jgi:hypothetical protein
MTTREDPIQVSQPLVLTAYSWSIPGLLTTVLRHRLILLILAAFALTPLLVPLMAPVAVGDDWVYVRSVEILLREGRLHILELSVVTLLFQVAWGSLFASIFGLSFGVLRLSTLVMALLGGLACYGLCRELQVARTPSAIAAAAYLFNPLSFVLAYTFMSDPHYSALLVIATYGYVRGLRDHREQVDRTALVLGSLAAACAFLVRQQGALIPAAVVAALLVQRRLQWDCGSLKRLLRIVAIPAIAIVGYYLWLVFVHGVPREQASFTQSVIGAGWEQSLLLFGRMTFIEAMYIGLFTLPVTLAALSALPRFVPVRGPAVWGVAFAWIILLAAGALHFHQGDAQQRLMPRMPYIAQYLGPNGLGPADLVGGRRWIISWQALDVLTTVCVISSLVFAVLLARQVVQSAVTDPSRARAGIVLMVALSQVAGILPPSFHFRNWIVSVDRYLLPLLPLSLCLAVWALRGLKPSFGAAWVAVVLAALISIAGTRDFLELQTAIWDLAETTIEGGVPLTALDAGAAWDGYALYDYGVAHGLSQQTPGGPWWTNLFAPATTSDYVVATAPIAGYHEVGHTKVSAWLDPDPTVLYLLQRGEPAS